MEDRTTSHPKIRSTDDGFGARAVTAILGRDTDRYIPSRVTCERCGCGGEDFSWFQRIPAGDVGDGVPEGELYFCDLLCLASYCSDRFDDYSPETLRPGVSY